MSSVALAVCEASALTSEATTAKPRPASPARAASMVAFSAKRLVCSAIEVISFNTSPMRSAVRDNSLMPASVCSACRTASSAIRGRLADLAADFMDRVGHFFLPSTTPPTGRWRTLAARWRRRPPRATGSFSAVLVRVPAEFSNLAEALDTAPMISPTTASKPSVILTTAAWCSCLTASR